VAAVVAALVLYLSESTEPPETLLARARVELRRRDYSAAERTALRVPSDAEVWAESRLVAGEAATRSGRYADAARHYDAVPRDGSPTSARAAFYFGEVCRELGRLTDADAAYAYVLKHTPDDATVRRRVAFLLGITGRRWESLPYFMALATAGEAGVYELVLLADIERPLEEPAYMKRCLARNPGDLLVRLGAASQNLIDGRSDEARRELREIVARSPDLLSAQAMLGELLVDAPSDSYLAWHAALPESADRHPDVWFVRGMRARRQGDLRIAARCFWEAVRLAPTHRRANYQLGQALVKLGEASGDDFSERAAGLVELTAVLDDVLKSQGRHEPAVKRAVEILERTGRIREAYAWSKAVASNFPGSTWPAETTARLTPMLRPDLPRTIDSANLALRYDLSGFPDHQSLFDSDVVARVARPAASPASIRFDEADVGIDFVYDNAADPSTDGARMPEQTGGGVAVIDFDLDGWPDLFFSQGGAWETGSLTPTPSPRGVDRAYRNLGGRRFVDETEATGLGDTGFGQGCAVGDFDGDGFPDLYVANIGRNGLYRGNGDGTFRGVTEGSGIEGDDWTASCAVVDLNADGLPDLFDATYVSGPDVYEAICDGRACSPKNFEGTPDRVRLNLGDGAFALLSDPAPARGSKGLGVVAFDLDRRGHPCLFVANDQVPNFLLRNLSGPEGGVTLEEQGFLTGLAYNEDGLAMAGMGVAAGDADGDGRLDFFVTNFADESNTLYLQDADGLFMDATKRSGLRTPSFPYVGWGTQFLDADLDGAPDLVVANGHVDDFSDTGHEYLMRPQVFRNLGGARFAELPSAEAGGYFAKRFLARGLARLDWNRDGLPDFVVSNIGDKASLVTNRSVGTGRFLNVRLHATRASRDAVGTVVDVSAGGRRWSQQLVAGDGYMASNERMLHFGLGTAEAVDELRARWPSGVETVLKDLPAGATVVLVEGRSRGILWPGTQPASPEVR